MHAVRAGRHSRWARPFPVLGELPLERVIRRGGRPKRDVDAARADHDQGDQRERSRDGRAVHDRGVLGLALGRADQPPFDLQSRAGDLACRHSFATHVALQLVELVAIDRGVVAVGRGRSGPVAQQGADKHDGRAQSQRRGDQEKEHGWSG